MAKAGRPRSPTPGPDSYSSASYHAFLSRLDATIADLDALQGRQERRSCVPRKSRA